MIKQIIILLISLTFSLGLFAQQTIDKIIYSKSQLQEDFSQFRNYLEKKTPNLYLYSSKATMDSLFNSLFANIEPMNATQFYYYINSIQPYIKDGHTYLFPSTELANYYSKNALYLPFDIRWINNKLYVVQNYSNSNNIKIGDEIVSINGKSAVDIFIDMCNHQLRDGNNVAYAEWINQHFFRGYYCNYYGFESHYKLEYKSTNNIKTLVVDGLLLDSINFRKNNTQNKVFDYNIYKTGIEIDVKNNIAYLSIRNWHNEELKNKYNQNFKKEIKKIFKKYNWSKIDNLVIDLRNNQGGNYENGIYFLKYLLQEPFKYFYSFKVLTRNRKLKNTAEGWLATRRFKPHRNSYKGKIYLLTNGGSYSNSGIFSSIIQTTKRGIIIGSETGGSANILTGGANKQYSLKHTHIGYTNTIIEMKVLNTTNKGAGVKPDIEIKSTVEDYKTNTDAVMNYIIKQIEK